MPTASGLAAAVAAQTVSSVSPMAGGTKATVHGSGPSGVTLTIAADAVVKALDSGLTVEGTLHAVGTAASPVTFTSFNDHSAGGSTGSGNAQPGDWAGIQVSGSADIENAAASYTTTAIDASDPVALTLKNDDQHRNASSSA